MFSGDFIEQVTKDFQRCYPNLKAKSIEELESFMISGDDFMLLKDKLSNNDYKFPFRYKEINIEANTSGVYFLKLLLVTTSKDGRYYTLFDLNAGYDQVIGESFVFLCKIED